MPTGIYVRKPLSEEHKKHISEALKGKHWKWSSEESKRKISEARKGKSNPHKGAPWSEESKKKMKGNKNTLGCHRSDEFKRKLREAHRGSKNWNWQDGISKKKGYRSFMNTRYKTKKFGNGGSHTFGEWENLKAQYNWTCPMCGRSEPEIQLTEDHIIPISRSGSNNIENIQPLCNSCNSKKNIKIFRVNPDGSLKLF